MQVVWRETGWGTILFLSALSGIDPQLYEAVAIDGAKNAALLAIEMMAITDDELHHKMKAFREEQARKILETEI